MRFYILIISTLVLLGNSYSQTPATIPAYYINLNTDTILTQIRLPKSMLSKAVLLSNFLNKVEIIDSVKGNKVFKAGDIKSFGFLFNGTNYQFFSPPCSKSFRKFLQAVILGQNANLYTYQTVDLNGNPLGAVYTIEKADGSCMFINTSERRTEIFKKKFLEFYNGNGEVQQLISTKFQNRNLLLDDIIEIVKSVNSD